MCLFLPYYMHSTSSVGAAMDTMHKAGWRLCMLSPHHPIVLDSSSPHRTPSPKPILSLEIARDLYSYHSMFALLIQPQNHASRVDTVWYVGRGRGVGEGTLVTFSALAKLPCELDVAFHLPSIILDHAIGYLLSDLQNMVTKTRGFSDFSNDPSRGAEGCSPGKILV